MRNPLHTTGPGHSGFAGTCLSALTLSAAVIGAACSGDAPEPIAIECSSREDLLLNAEACVSDALDCLTCWTNNSGGFSIGRELALITDLSKARSDHDLAGVLNALDSSVQCLFGEDPSQQTMQMILNRFHEAPMERFAADVRALLEVSGVVIEALSPEERVAFKTLRDDVLNLDV